jgi:hypothetical protein
MCRAIAGNASSQCGFINSGDQSAFCRGVTGR